MAEIQKWLAEIGIRFSEGENLIDSLVFSNEHDALLLTNKRLFYLDTSRETTILVGLHKDVSAFQFIKLGRSAGLLVSGIILAIATAALAISTQFVESETVKFGLMAGGGLCAIITPILIISYFFSGGAKFKCWIGGQQVDNDVSSKQVEDALDFMNRFYEQVQPEHP